MGLGHPLTYPKDRWVCPITGEVVPKDPVDNAAWRLELVKSGEADPAGQGVRIMDVCRASFLFWINAFGWTYRLIEHTATGSRESSLSFEVPFITWPVQDAAYLEIARARKDGKKVAIEKSRDMGASWLNISYVTHDCTYCGTSRPANWLLMSKKEEDVYMLGNQKALFSKIKFLLDRMPTFMRPRFSMVHRLITFPDIGSVIAGETTNNFAGVGDRVTGMLLDEASAMERLAQIEAETSDTGPFRIFNSTNRAGTYYTSHLLPSGRVRIVQMPWWDHPEKGKDRSTFTDPDTKQVKFTSPWYRVQEKERSRIDIAQNLDMDRMGAGTGVFDSRTVSRQKSMYRPARVLYGDIGLPEDVRVDKDLSLTRWPHSKIGWIERPDFRLAKWRWFGELLPDSEGRLRPDQDHAYALGVDVSTGKGVSPSVISVIDCDTGWKVGRFLSTWTSPEALGEMVYLAGLWIGGRTKTPLAVVEANGPGDNALIRLKALGYGTIYHHSRFVHDSDKPTDALGWNSNTRDKCILLETYAGSLSSDKFKNPDEEALDECMCYLYLDGGGIGHHNTSEMTEEERRRHGDMVVSDALGDLGRRKTPQKKLEDHTPPPGSFGARKLRHAEKQKQLRAMLSGR